MSIIIKTVFAGVAVGAALALVSADAAERHHRHRAVFGAVGHHAWAAAPIERGPGDVSGRDLGGYPGYPTAFRLPAHPLVWDCVHVVFPQCDRGFDGLNDGSYK